MIEKMKDELRSIEDGIVYMEQTDTAWSRSYTYLCKIRRKLKRKIRRLEKKEAKKNEL